MLNSLGNTTGQYLHDKDPLFDYHVSNYLVDSEELWHDGAGNGLAGLG